MRLVDLKEEKTFRQFYNPLMEFIEQEIVPGNFKLKNNYLNINFDDYLSFTLLLEKEEIVAFSGLQRAHFPEGYGRVLNKLYYGEKIKARGYRIFPSLATEYMLPHQVSVGRKKNLNFVFISFQSDLKRKNFLKNYEKCLNDSFGKQAWKLLGGFYNTCPILPEGVNEDPSCWQSILFMDMGEGKKKFQLPFRATLGASRGRPA